MVRNTRPGYRYFRCDDCGTDWKSASRDYRSASVEHCPNGDCEFQPANSPRGNQFVDLPVDKDGNLLDSVNQEAILLHK